MKRFLLAMLTLFLITAGHATAANLSDAFGVNNGNNNDNLDKVAVTANYNTNGAGGQLEAKVGTVISSVLSFLGVIFIVLMFYGGFLWMSARGNEQQIEKARNVIIPAIIGLVVVLSAYAISYFVIKSLMTAPTPF